MKHIWLCLLFLFTACFTYGYDEVYRGEQVIEPLLPANYPLNENICRIFLVRHGETEWNVLGQSQGWEDVPLNAHGKEQAAHLAYCLSTLSVHAVYSSILSRAVETSEKIADYHPDCVLIFDGALRFYDPKKKYEDSELTKDEIEDAIAAEITQLASAYLKNVSRYHLGQNVVIITHGKVIKHVVESLLQNDRVKVKIDNTAIVRVIGDMDTLRLE